VGVAADRGDGGNPNNSRKTKRGQPTSFGGGFSLVGPTTHARWRSTNLLRKHLSARLCRATNGFAVCGNAAQRFQCD